MNDLKQLQYKCSSVDLKWNNEQWEITARLPNGTGCVRAGMDAAKVIAHALLWINAHLPQTGKEVSR